MQLGKPLISPQLQEAQANPNTIMLYPCQKVVTATLHRIIDTSAEKPHILETHYVDDPQYDSLSIRNRAVEAKRHKQDAKSSINTPTAAPVASPPKTSSKREKTFYNPPLPEGLFDPEVPLLLNIGIIVWLHTQ